MKLLHKYGRVAAREGKHGPGDWRIEFNGAAPTHAEALFMLGMLLVAEDRYAGRDDLGRRMLWAFVDRLQTAWTPTEVVAIANRCQTSIDPPSRRGRAA